MNAGIDVAGLTLIHFLWQGTLLWIAAAAALRLLAPATATTRYAVACAALAAMLALPIVTAIRLSDASANPTRTSQPAPTALTTAPTTEAEPQIASVRGIVQIGRDSALPVTPANIPLLRGIVLAWLLGIALLSGRLIGGWRKVRRLRLATAVTATTSIWEPLVRRLAARLQLTCDIHVADSDDVDSPIVLGWLRPVLVLPIAALAALTPEQVEAILAHELAHVRRHDFVVNLLQTLVEIVLFYHPAVWWISRRIRIEREHCCDMVAVSLCDDPVAYCQALTELESHRASRHALALGATDGSLLERVRRVLGEPPRREAWSGRVSSAALIAGVLLVAAGGASYLGAAQPADTRSSGSAPRSASALPWRVVIGYPGGEYRLIGYGGRALIAMAYGNAEARVLGGHRWIDDEPFELTLRAGTRPDDDQLSALLRRELDTRLSLRAHRGRRDFPAFALVSLNGPGRNLRPATRECFDVEEWAASGAPTVDLPFGQRTTICRAWDSGLTRGSVASATMASFTRDLRHTFADAFGERDLIDRTGLSGTYDIDLEFFLPAIALMRWSPVADTALYLAGFRDLPDVLEDQLGLAIEETTAPYDVVVIDHVERPTRR